MVHGKLHESRHQTTLLPLLMDKAEITEHGDILQFHHTEGPCSQLLANGTDGDDAHAVGAL